MENLILMGDLDSWVTLKEGFEVSKNEQGMPLQQDKWTRNQVQKSKVNSKVTKLLLNVLPNKILCKLGRYKNVYDL